MLLIKCSSVNELSHRIGNDFVNKTTSNWQGKVNFHYFFRINNYTTPSLVELKISPLMLDCRKQPPSLCIWVAVCGRFDCRSFNLKVSAGIRAGKKKVKKMKMTPGN